MATKSNKDYVDEWKSLPWKKFRKNLFRLQHRIYKAAKKNDYDSVKRLQTLLLGSKCSKFLAIRQVTQLNAGKKTAGVDGFKSLNPKQRFQLVDELGQMSDWKHRKLRRVWITKPNGKPERPLGIPTISDRAMQCHVKHALEPVYESYASDGSYGFRPGHSTWDVQNRIFQNLKANCRGYEKSILEIDIEKCFDEIDHQKLLSLTVLPGTAKKFLKSALTAGVLKECDKRNRGTPQGGVISPVLCNIALHGVEDLHNEWKFRQRYQRGLRYADDMVFILKPGECGETLLAKVKEYLQERGLKVSEAKTKLVKATDGFDFLGWHFKVKAKNNKFVCYPSSKNRRKMINKIKSTLKDTRYTLSDRLKKIKVIYRGWFNYHQYSDMSQVNLWSISTWVYKYLKKKSKIPHEKVIEHCQSIFNGHHYKVNRYPAARGSLSVFDGNLLYWSRRNSKRYSGPLATVLRKQDYICNSCRLRFTPDDWIELHHINGNNADFRTSNVEALHRSCHHYQSVHSIIRKISCNT
jgi:RNA-directed DNA polymerase